MERFPRQQRQGQAAAQDLSAAFPFGTIEFDHVPPLGRGLLFMLWGKAKKGKSSEQSGTSRR
jgi:hypothetical protein